MGKLKRDFFVSYTGTDEKWAEWISAILEANGYSCFLQKWDFRVGENFVVNMHEALKNSDRFIAVLSKEYFDSMYCQAEWTSAFTKDPNGEQRLFIPVRIADIAPEGLLSAIIYIDLFGKSEEQEAEAALLQGVNTKNIPRNRPSFPGTAKVRFPGSLPFNNLPYIKNVYFTGRNGVLMDICDTFENENAVSLTQLITGLGGVGKTQIALEYSYRYAHKYNWIWWVSAETEATVLASYQSFANKLGLIDKQTDGKYIIETVLNWLDTHSEWLFIYDNADKISTDTYWWPKNIKGNVLITTRNHHNHIGKVLNVATFSKEEAVDFLVMRVDCDNNRDSALALSERLGFLPLALEQAAAYIKNNECTYSEYLELLEKYGLDVLKETDGVIDYTLPITATWQISIDKVNSEAARQLLYLCAYLASECIYKSIFSENFGELPMPLKDTISNELTSNKIWTSLTQYSLLEKQGTQGYSMHRLLQEVIRHNIDSDPQWARYCLGTLYISYLFMQYLPFFSMVKDHIGDAVERSFISYIPHIEAFAKNSELALKDVEDKTKIGQLCGESGQRCYNSGNYNQALIFFKKMLEISEDLWGLEDQNTVDSYGFIIATYVSQGDYAKALEWLKKLLETQERILGTDHIYTVNTYIDIARTYLYPNDNVNALEWGMKALAICEKVPKDEHPCIATTFDIIGQAYNCGGDYPNALKWHEKARVCKESTLGKKHLNTTNTYESIAGVYLATGDYAQALVLSMEAFEIRVELFGEYHQMTAMSCANISISYRCMGDLDEALRWGERALAIRVNVLGENNTETAVAYLIIADVLDAQGNLHKALDLCEKSLKILKSDSIMYHPHTDMVKDKIAKLKSRI